jgi:Cu2+-exporting ATPase
VTPAGEERHQDGERTLRFCCRGCLGAYLLITGAGLGAYYERRGAPEHVVPPEPAAREYDEEELARHVTPAPDGLGSMDILIDGIRCAACVWLNEQLLERLDGVVSARVNYATARARVVFDPRRVTPLLIFAQLERAGYCPRPHTSSALDQLRERERHDLLLRFGTAFFLTMQLMAYSFALYAGYLQGMSPGMKLLMQLFSLAVTAPVVFYSGWPFLEGAWRGLANRSAGMDLLIATGALSSFLYSVYATVAGGEVYYETAAMIVTLILGGRLLENAARRRAAGGIDRLLELAPAEALLLRDGGYEKVATEQLSPGDRVMVPQGGRFPVDGTLAEGEAEVDESPVTGEPLPLMRRRGEPIMAGTINRGQGVVLLVGRRATESFVARITRLVEEAQSRKAPIQGVADRIAAVFVPAVLLLALGTFAVRLGMGSSGGEALMIALAVVVIACPCALGLATPTAVLAGTGAAAAQGIIFRGGDVIERLASITMALFDKTGTLTEGRPLVALLEPAPSFGAAEVLALAASLEQAVSHPVAAGICRHAETSGVVMTVPAQLRSVPGRGAMGMVSGRRVAVGTRQWLRESAPEALLPETASSAEQTEVYVALDGRYAGRIVLKDRLRPQARQAVDHFARCGVRSLMLSGDRQATAERVAREAGIIQVHGDLLPEEKVRRVEELRRGGERVLMAGDGINDAAALSAADVGCAMAGGTDIAIETSDLLLSRADLLQLGTAHSLALRTMGVIRQNLGWAFIYNLIGIPLAMAGLLTPIYAAAAMSVSSLCVVLNSLRLLRLPRQWRCIESEGAGRWQHHPVRPAERG